MRVLSDRNEISKLFQRDLVRFYRGPIGREGGIAVDRKIQSKILNNAYFIFGMPP